MNPTYWATVSGTPQAPLWGTISATATHTGAQSERRYGPVPKSKHTQAESGTSQLPLLVATPRMNISQEDAR